MEEVWGIFTYVILFAIIAYAVKLGVKEALHNIIDEYDLKEVWENSKKNSKSE